MRSRFAAMIFSACIGNLAIPIVAIFVPLLAYRLGADALEVGTVGGVTYAVFVFMPPLLGRYSDRLKSRGVLVAVALVVIFPAYVLYAVVSSPVELIVLRALEGIGWAIFWVTLDVLVGEESSMESSKAYSLYNAAWSVVAAISPLVGTALVLLIDLRAVFLIMAATVAFAAIVASLFLNKSDTVGHEAPLEPERTHTESDLGSNVTVSEGATSTYVAAVYMIAILVANSMRGILFSFFPSFGTLEGFSLLAIGLIVFGFGAGRLVTYLVLTRDRFRGALLRKETLRRNIIIAMVLAIVAGTFPLFPDKTGALDFLSFALVGVSTSTVMTIGQVELIAKASPARRGRGAGLFESSVGTGTGAAPILAGLVAGQSLSLPFLYGPIACIATLPILFGLFSRKTPAQLRH